MVDLLSSEAVLVLGMHRSGTSLLMRICNLLGVTLADDLIPPRDDNAKGFFEHAEVVEINERIFKHFGVTSQDVIPFPGEWWELPGIVPFKDELKSCLSQTYSGKNLWGIKDPRIGKLLPLWLPLLRDLGVNPRIVIAFRDPMEVAKSLQKRDNISLERGLLLWLQYNLAIERETRGLTRHFIHYPDVLNHTDRVVETLIQAIPELNAIDRDNINTSIAGFIDPSLRHHNASESESIMPKPMQSLYMHMVEVSQGEILDTKRFGEIQMLSDMFMVPFQETVVGLNPALHAWREMIDVQGKERTALREQVAMLEQRICSMQDEALPVIFRKLKRCVGM